MYLNGFGSNYILFITGGISGTVLIYIASKWLSYYKSKYVTTLSTGSIIILGFHVIIINYARSVLIIPSWKDYIMALIIMVIFIPTIILTEKYAPILIGKYRIR